MALVLGVGLTSLLWLTDRGPFEPSCTDFSSDEWQDSDPRYRQDQADLLLECGTLDGKTKREVISLLGKPDFDYPIGPKNRAATWEVGTTFIDPLLLYVQFDEMGLDGKVVAARLVSGG